MAGGAPTVPAPGWAPAARAGIPGCRRRGVKRAARGLGVASGRRAVPGWGRRGGIEPAPGRNGGDQRYFFKYL